MRLPITRYLRRERDEVLLPAGHEPKALLRPTGLGLFDAIASAIIVALGRF